MAIIRVIRSGDNDRPNGAGVYYPLWFLRLSASWRRLFLPRKRGEILVCVDGVRGVAHRADVMPDSVEMNVAEGSVVPLEVDDSAAAAGAYKLARWWATARLFSWWEPEMRVLESHLLHKLYLIEEDPSGRVLRDSVTGETGRL